MKKSMLIETIPERLLDEAIESLGYGLKYYDEYQTSDNMGIIKQSIIMLHGFTEYSLNYFIAKINPLLVFTKSFDKDLDINKSHTISFDKALDFYINNLEYGLIGNLIEFEFESKKFKQIILGIKKLRNKMTHWFIHPDEISDIDHKLSDIIYLIYCIYLDEKINHIIHEKLPSEQLVILDNLIDTQSIKLDKAMEKVEKYISDRTSYDSREASDTEAPLFTCPACDRETFILSDTKDNTFECTFCNNTEEAEQCSVSLVCITREVPKCHLSSWNDEYDAMICDDCNDYFEYKVSKD